MDDVTDTVFRQIVADSAPPDLYFTEFVNVDGLQSPGRNKLFKKLQYTKKEQPIIAQIWGKNPNNYYKTAKELVQMGFTGIDINMGCPEKSVIKNGCCVALVDNRELAEEIILATREAVGPLFPVSVKTRLGLKKIDLSWLEFLLKRKLDMLTIHGRTARQLSRVPADWAAIGKIRTMRDAIAPGTLIVGNGDVKNAQHGVKLAKQYKLDGIMIGRGIFDDPFVFASPLNNGSPWANYTRQQKVTLYRKHVELFAKTWQHGEKRVWTLNKFCKIYINNFSGAKEAREKLMRANDIDELLRLLAQVA